MKLTKSPRQIKKRSNRKFYESLKYKIKYIKFFLFSMSSFRFLPVCRYYSQFMFNLFNTRMIHWEQRDFVVAFLCECLFFMWIYCEDFIVQFVLFVAFSRHFLFVCKYLINIQGMNSRCLVAFSQFKDGRQQKFGIKDLDWKRFSMINRHLN